MLQDHPTQNHKASAGIGGYVHRCPSNRFIRDKPRQLCFWVEKSLASATVVLIFSRVASWNCAYRRRHATGCMDLIGLRLVAAVLLGAEIWRCGSPRTRHHSLDSPMFVSRLKPRPGLSQTTRGPRGPTRCFRFIGPARN